MIKTMAQQKFLMLHRLALYRMELLLKTLDPRVNSFLFLKMDALLQL